MEYIEEFIHHLLIEKGLSQNTIVAYKNNIKHFFIFYQDVISSSVSLESITLQDCIRYCSFLGRHGASSATIAQHISSLKSFFIFLERKEYITSSPLLFLSTPKQHSTIPSILTLEEINSLLARPNKKTKLGMRDATILELLYATGMRVSELCSLDLLSLDLDRGFIRVSGKGSKERVIPLYHEICLLLKEYLISYRPLFCPIDSVVFLNRSGMKLSRQAIFLLIQKYAKQAGIHKTISPHTIRHSFASHMIENGADIRTVQILLGHEDISTTEVYLQLRIEHIMNAHRKFHPRN